MIFSILKVGFLPSPDISCILVLPNRCGTGLRSRGVIKAYLPARKMLHPHREWKFASLRCTCLATLNDINVGPGTPDRAMTSIDIQASPAIGYILCICSALRACVSTWWHCDTGMTAVRARSNIIFGFVSRRSPATQIPMSYRLVLGHL